MSDDLRRWAHVDAAPFHFAAGEGDDPRQDWKARLTRMSDGEVLEWVGEFGSKLLDAWRAGHCDDPRDRSLLRAAAKAVPDLSARLSERELHDLGIV